MRRAALVIAAGACGRVAFDPISDGAGGDVAVTAAARCGVESSLVACYPLDGTADDISGFANHGSGSAIWGPGRTGGAARFDMTTNLRVPDTASMDFEAGLTVMAWVRLDMAPGTGRGVIIDRNKGFAFGVRDAGQLALSVSIGGSTGTGYVTGTTPIDLGVWTHVAATYDGSMTAVYVHGAEVGRQPASGLLDTADTDGTRIGGDVTSGGGDDPFFGAIDDLGIWSVALPPARIACAVTGDC